MTSLGSRGGNPTDRFRVIEGGEAELRADHSLVWAGDPRTWLAFGRYRGKEAVMEGSVSKGGEQVARGVPDLCE